ncbi:MAG: cell division protein FtsQ/DivIB [Syntrophales bacterium]
MKRSLRASLEIKRNWLRRHSRKIFRDVLAGVIMTGAVGVVFCLLVLAYSLVLSASFFQVEKTVVTGCEKVTEKEILELSGLKPSQNILALNTGLMERRIKSNPWIQEVSITRNLPRNLLIEIKERKAVALIRRESTLFFMDENGTVFKKLDAGERADLPILTGFYDRGKEDLELIRKSIELLAFLSSSNDFPKIENISEIQGDVIFGFSLFVDNGLHIQLGFDDYENKLRRLKPVMADLARKNMDGFLSIDLKDPTKVTVQRKSAPAFPKFTKGYRT